MEASAAVPVVPSDLEILRAELRSFIASVLEPPIERGEEQRHFDAGVINSIAAAGCLGRLLPVELGGRAQLIDAYTPPIGGRDRKPGELS
jgi:alkylation response protein AidB-like acyl-CoA dehydrogenase